MEYKKIGDKLFLEEQKLTWCRTKKGKKQKVIKKVIYIRDVSNEINHIAAYEAVNYISNLVKSIGFARPIPKVKNIDVKELI